MKNAKSLIIFLLSIIMLVSTLLLISSCSGEGDPNGTYTASFYADGKLVEKVRFSPKDKEIANTPRVPRKKGMVGAWEDYTLKAKNIKINAVYAESFTVKVVADDPHAFEFSGETEQVITETNPKMKIVTIKPKDGYDVDYYEINGKKYDGKHIAWKNVNADATIIVHAKFTMNELPIISIDTGDASINSKSEYTPMTFNMKNCDDQLHNISGGIRLRGNSTLGLPKKAFRIKFDKKQSVMGLDKAKSWVLLADYLDPSALHNHAAFTLANQMPGLSFTPTPHKVNVFINGQYVGLYTLCKQIQEDEGRMNIEMKEITPEMRNFKDYNWFVSLDYNAQFDGLVENETLLTFPNHGNIYFKTMYFEIKYPEKADFPSEEQFNWFVTELRNCIENLLNDFESQNADNIKKKTNVNSLIDYVIIDEILGQTDHDEWHKSFNIYYTCTSDNPEENKKINFGPIWDYDWIMDGPWTGKPNESYKLNDDIEGLEPFYNVMYEVDEFYKTMKARYNKYAKPALKKYLDKYDALAKSIENSLDANAELWYTNFDPEMTDKNVEFFKEWLTHRYNLLNEAWKN